MEVKGDQTNTKLRIFQSNVKSVLFYGSETWRTSKETTRKLQNFINGCLRGIGGLRWYKITNEELRERTTEETLVMDRTYNETDRKHCKTCTILEPPGKEN